MSLCLRLVQDIVGLVLCGVLLLFNRVPLRNVNQGSTFSIVNLNVTEWIMGSSFSFKLESVPGPWYLHSMFVAQAGGWQHVVLGYGGRF